MSQDLYPNLMFGGTGGSPFDDIASSPTTIVGIIGIDISYDGSDVNSIQTGYIRSDGSIYEPVHGTSSGTTATIPLGYDKTIISVEGRYGSRINQLQFTTRNVSGEIEVYGPYGGGGGSPFVVNGIVGGFFGRSNSAIDALGFYLTSPSSQQYGGTGGTVFSDAMLIQEPPVIGIESINIWSASRVDGIQINYLLADGTVYAAPSHGGTGNDKNKHVIEFESNEQILAVVGRSQDKIDQLNFLTITDTGLRNTYGPYGGNGGTPFILNNQVLGIFGRSQTEVDALGFYTAYAPPIEGVTVYGFNGYLYCVLESTQDSDICAIPVGPTATDLSFRLQYLDTDNASGVGFTVRAPDGTNYGSESDGTDGIWAYPASDAGLGLQTFYIQDPMAGTWQATISTSVETCWSVIGSTNPDDATHIARDAFSQLGPSEKKHVYNGIAPGGTEIPPENCYFCQAQAVVIMGLAAATFYYWVGPVEASSAVVLYAERLLGRGAATWVSRINSLYSAWQAGTSSWNLARLLCEELEFCPRSPRS